MKKHRFIAAAVLTAALAAAMAVPAWASAVETVIQQIDEPLDTDVSGEEASLEEITVAEEQPVSPQSAETADIQAADISEQEAIKLTAEQRSIILELVPDDLYRFYTSSLWDAVPETSVDLAAVYAQDLVNELYGVLRNAGRNSAIFIPVEHGEVEGYSVWFDKDDALQKIAGLYGRDITEAAIAEYNTEWGGDMPDMIAVSGNAIASLDPDGEGKVHPSIESAVMDGDDLIVSLTFTATFDDSRNNGSGRATAVFAEEPQSILGYRLKSISLNQ